MTLILLILIPSFKFDPNSCFEYLNCFRCYKVKSAWKIPLWYLVKKALQTKTDAKHIDFFTSLASIWILGLPAKSSPIVKGDHKGL
jgi:hypothetical protein